MKAEVEKILEIAVASKYNYVDPRVKKRNINQATLALTALIIKWLESKREQGIKFHSGRQNSELSAYSPTDNQKVGRNQLITELIGEVK